MIEDNAQIVEQLIEVIKSGSGVSVVEYTKWHSMNALSWTLAGVSFLVISAVLFMIEIKSTIADGAFCIAGVLFLIFGIIIVASNLSTIYEPQAFAIHQLIRDLMAE